MIEVSVPPYILTDADGSNPRIIIPVKTPAAVVMVESRTPGRLLVRDASAEGARCAIDTARQYVRRHRRRIDGLYAQMDRIEKSAPRGQL